METYGFSHRANDALGLRLARKVEERVHRGHDNVQLRQGRIRQIEAAIFQNVDFDAFEDREPFELDVELVHFANLARDPGRIEAMRHGDPAAMVGQRHVFVAARLRRLRHLFNGRRAVGPVGVGVQVAANIVDCHQPRQLSGLGECNFATVLAHFRRDVSQRRVFYRLPPRSLRRCDACPKRARIRSTSICACWQWHAAQCCVTLSR